MGYYKKKLSRVLSLFLYISFFASILVTKEVNASSVNVTNHVSTYNSEEVIINTYEQAETSWIVWADNYLQSHGGIDSSDSTCVNIKNILTKLRSNGYYVIFDRSIGTSLTDGSINVILIDPYTASHVSLTTGDFKSYNGSWTYTDVPGYQINNVAWYKLNVSGSFTIVSSSTSGYLFMPRAVYLKYDNILDNFIRQYLGDNFETTQQVSVVNMNNVIQALNNINQKTDETNNQLENLNNYMNSNDTSGIDDSFSQPSVNDTTEGGFSNIFNLFYQYATSTDTGQSIEVPVPFTNKSFIIRGNMTQNIVNNHTSGFLKTLLNGFWYCVVSLFIVKDIAKIVRDIRSGDIMTKTDTNIKTEML